MSKQFLTAEEKFEEWLKLDTIGYHNVGTHGPTQWNVYKINSPKILQWLHTCDNIGWVKITGFTGVAYALSKDLEVMMKLKF